MDHSTNEPTRPNNSPVTKAPPDCPKINAFERKTEHGRPHSCEKSAGSMMKAQKTPIPISPQPIRVKTIRDTVNNILSNVRQPYVVKVSESFDEIRSVPEDICIGWSPRSRKAHVSFPIRSPGAATT